ncbi:unnamed protein product, partial [Didymodactylos carnosus]
MQSSLAIINGCLNSVNKQGLTLDDLSTADLITIIRHLSREIDENNNNSSTNSHNSTDDALNSLNNHANSNEIIMRLLNQNEMLIKTLCNNYEQKQEQSHSDRCPTFCKSQNDDTDLLKTGTFYPNSSQNIPSTSLPPSNCTDNRVSTPLKTTTGKGNSNQMKSSTNVTILGSSIIRDLKQGNTTLNNKPHNIYVRTKYGCSIEHMNELVLNREIFPSKILIFSLGTINMKFDKPDDAFNKIIALTDSLKLSYPNSKLVFTT